MHPQAIGKTVRWARKRARMTQVQLAAACNMPQATVARIERGTVMPRSTTLLQLLEATGHELLVDSATAPTPERESIRARLRQPVARRTQASLTPATANELRRLGRAGVRLVLIGAVAEAAHGAPHRAISTAEICCAPEAANRERLAAVLETDARHIRVIDEPIPGEGFELLARTAEPMQVAAGLRMHVASLADLVRIRRAQGQPADREALAVLSALRDELDEFTAVG